MLKDNQKRIQISLIILFLAFLFVFSISSVSASNDTDIQSTSAENGNYKSASLEGSMAGVTVNSHIKSTSNYYLNTRITGLKDVQVTPGKKVPLKVKLEAYYNHAWDGLGFRYINFYLYDKTGQQVWHDKVLTNFYTSYASTSINTKTLNLLPETYRIVAQYGGNIKDGLNPCESTAYLILNPRNTNSKPQPGDSRISGLHDYIINTGEKVKISAGLEIYEYVYDISADPDKLVWHSKPFRYLNFYLLDSNGLLLWSETHKLAFIYTASATIDNKKLNLSPGTYYIRVTYDGNSKEGIKSCFATAKLYITKLIELI